MKEGFSHDKKTKKQTLDGCFDVLYRYCRSYLIIFEGHEIGTSKFSSRPFLRLSGIRLVFWEAEKNEQRRAADGPLDLQRPHEFFRRSR